VITGGKVADRCTGSCFEPTVLVSCGQDMDIMRKEIFGRTRRLARLRYCAQRLFPQGLGTWVRPIPAGRRANLKRRVTHGKRPNGPTGLRIQSVMMGRSPLVHRFQVSSP
jgi:hypothetical protein